MRRPQGYSIVVEPDKPNAEQDTITCIHCNGIVFVDAGKDPSDLGGFCMMCHRNICATCAATGKCDPFEKKLERIEGKDRLYRAAMGA